MQKLLLVFLMLISVDSFAKVLSCTEQFIGVVTLADGTEFPSAITNEEKLYRNTVEDYGNSFIVVLKNGYKLKSGKMQLQPNGVLIKIYQNGLTYMKVGDKFLIGETEHEPRYREWSVYKNCK